MELRRLSLWLALVVLAAICQCSEARHSELRRRRSNDYFNDEAEDPQNDEGNDANETEGNVVYSITSSPETYHVMVGGKVRLYCNLEPKDSKSVVSWIKGESETLFLGGAKLFFKYPADKFQLEEGHSLVIKDLSFEDSGRYTCQVQQADKVSLTHTIRVEEPAQITDPEATTMGYVDSDDDGAAIVSFTVSNNAPVEGSDVQFTCVTRGSPQPKIIFSRQTIHQASTETLPQGRHEISGSTAVLRNLTRADTGNYLCYALNTINVNVTKSATAMVKLTVYGKPHLHAHRHVINSAIGIKAELKCSSLDGPHHISWFKNGQSLALYVPSKYSIRRSETEEGSENTLIVTPTSEEDFGTFTCEATNQYGTHRKSVELVQRPVVEGVNVEGNKVSWIVLSHQPLEELEIALKPLSEEGEARTIKVPASELVGNSTKPRHHYDMSYELDDKELFGKYEVTVGVKNNKDWSTPSEPVYFQGILQNQVQSTEPTIVHAGFAGVDRPSTKGAYATHPALFLNAIMMYLLVRMM